MVLTSSCEAPALVELGFCRQEIIVTADTQTVHAMTDALMVTWGEHTDVIRKERAGWGKGGGGSLRWVGSWEGLFEEVMLKLRFT